MTRCCGLVLAVLFALCLGACPGEGPGEPATTPGGGEPASEKERVQGHVHALFTATYEPDLDTIVALTHPYVIELLGGESGMRETLEELLPGLAELTKVEKIGFPAEPTFLTGTENEFVIVPTEMVMSVGDAIVESRDFLFGARKIGETNWRYVQGAQVISVLPRFPDFPSDFEFPETSMTPR